MKRPLSMTGFGRAELTGIGRSCNVEVRSVNHRFLDIKIKLPSRYAMLEERIRRTIGESYSRGHVNVVITPAGETEEGTHLQPNLSLARDYYNSLLTIKQELSLDGTPDLAMLAGFKDMIVPVEIEEDLDELWFGMEAALREALDNSRQMRANEGQNLKEDLLARLSLFGGTVDDIELSIPELIAKKETQLKERIAILIQGVEVDPMRLAQEVAIMADRSDVTEEIVRLRSHINQFQNFLELDEPIGRRLDFLLQEFLREINTLASKINDAAIAHKTVELKNELEKMREQVQNLE